MRTWTYIVALVLVGCSFDPSVNREQNTDAADDGGMDVADIDGTADASVSDSHTPADLDIVDIGDDSDGGDLGDMGTDVGPPMPLPEGATTVVDGALVLHTALPHLVDDCTPGATPCDDLDGDGLLDAWEDLVLDRFRPLLVFDEQEELFDDPDSVVAHVGRVAPMRRSDRVMMWLPVLYDRDYGTCGSLTSHPGDSERVVLVLSIGATVSMDRVYTAAHENTPNDHSMTFAGADLLQLEYDETIPNAARWVVYPSKNKHATYATRAICEGVSPIPCFNEACGPDGVDRAAFSMLADVVNVGEPDLPRVDDLTPLGFAGESAWADQDFCGGHEGGGCPGAVRQKLTTNPFQ